MSRNAEPLALRTLQRTCDIGAREVRAISACFSLVLVLMAACYILRPVRDAIASK